MGFNQQEYTNKYIRENYYKPSIKVRKCKKSIIEEVSNNMNKPINRLFIEAFEKQYNVDLTTIKDGE